MTTPGPEWRSPPEIPRDARLDFSQFHDLLHRPFTRHCFSMYGGPRRHVSLWWEYKASEALRAATLCRVGRHRSSQMFRMKDRVATSTQVVCSDCGRQLSKEQPV